MVDSEKVGWTGLLGTLPAEGAPKSSLSSSSQGPWSSSSSSLAEGPSENAASSELELGELDVRARELDVVGGRDEDVSVFVIVTVCVPVRPGNVGSITVVYSDWSGAMSPLKLARKGSQSK